MTKIIEDTTGAYEVMRFCAILEIKNKEAEIEMSSPIVKDLHTVFSDITYNVTKHRIELMHNMQYSKYMGYSNKEMVTFLTNKLKEYLKIADITIIEQRLPLDEVRYKLTNES